MFTQRLHFSSGLSAFAFFGLTLLLASPESARGAGPRRFDTVVVDAGHGGYDPGGILGVRTRPTEKEVALDVARRLARTLRASGFRVVMTRDEDVFVPLGQRAAPTGQLRGRAVFISIHFNAARRAGARGIETYYYRADSLGLATRVHRTVLAATGAEDRFVHRRGFFVIRRSAVPAILCECGFLTNPEDNRLASSADYRQRLATAVATGLAAQSRGGDPAGLRVPVLESPTSHVYRRPRSHGYRRPRSHGHPQARKRLHRTHRHR